MRPVLDGPLVRDETEWTKQQSGGGRSRTEIIDALLEQRYGPSSIVRSLVDGLGLTVAIARAQVADRLAAHDASRFEVMWSEAESRAGDSADDALHAIEDFASKRAELTEVDIDLSDAYEVIAVERMRRIGSTTDAIGWFRSALLRYRHRAAQFVVIVAIDRVGCPTVLVPDLLAVARSADAQSCRWPLAAIVRSHGVASVASERDRLTASHDPGNERVAEKWSYWLRTDFGQG